MIEIIVTVAQILALLFGRSVGPEQEGVASQYTAGRMEEVIRNRQAGRTEIDLPLELPPVHGYIAVKDCAQVGKLWIVQPEGGTPELFLVADCPCYGDGTVMWMIAGNIILEIDHKTAERWDTINSGIKVHAWTLSK